MADENLAEHILPNAATMVGICVTAVGLVKVVEARIGPSNVDIYCSVAGVVFLISALCSYLSLRMVSHGPFRRMLERAADMSFMVGLVALTGITVLFAFEVI